MNDSALLAFRATSEDRIKTIVGVRDIAAVAIVLFREHMKLAPSEKTYYLAAVTFDTAMTTKDSAKPLPFGVAIFTLWLRAVEEMNLEVGRCLRKCARAEE